MANFYQMSLNQIFELNLLMDLEIIVNEKDFDLHLVQSSVFTDFCLLREDILLRVKYFQQGPRYAVIYPTREFLDNDLVEGIHLK